MIRYALPSIEDLLLLGEHYPHALSIYVPTSPTAAGRDASFTAAKSAVDEGIRRLRAAGTDAADVDAVKAQWEVVADDDALWGKLSGSLAMFLAPGFGVEYVLPNDLEPQQQVADYFDVGQLVRAVTTPQEAYALTISTNGWNLWECSAAARASEVELSAEYAEDAADATNRMTIRGRQHLRRLVGDEGKKVLQERYTKIVIDGLRAELGRLDPNATKPLFVFANEPIMSMVVGEDLPWQVVPVLGAPDELRPDEIDEAVRSRIGALTAAAVSARADRIGDGFASGLAVTDIAQLGRAAASGAVATMIYDFTIDVLGTVDEASGAVTFDDEHGYDLLSRLATMVLSQGGEVIAVRAGEVDAQIWNGKVLAELRFALA